MKTPFDSRWLFGLMVLAQLGSLTVQNSLAQSPTLAPKSTNASEATVAARTSTLASVSDVMQKALQAGEFSGAVTAVYHRNRVVHMQAIGAADIQSERKMRATTRFAIASMTKPITATGLMMLVEEGKLSIDDPVAKFLPEFEMLKLSNGDLISRPMTIRDAVTHTSGLAGSQTFDGTLADAVDELAKRPLAFQPGTKWQYSPGINVVGRIIEVVTEQPLDEFLHARIFEPLRMNRTTFRPDPEDLSTLATIYQPGDEPGRLKPIANRIVDPQHVRGVNPSGGLFSTAHDLVRFYSMILNGGQGPKGQPLLSPVSIAAMTSPVTGDLTTGFTPGNAWGLGWCVVREPQGVTEMLNAGTYGHGGAFGTQAWIDPVTQTVYLLLIQRAKFGNSDASDLRGAFQRAAVTELGLRQAKMSSTSSP